MNLILLAGDNPVWELLQQLFDNVALIQLIQSLGILFFILVLLVLLVPYILDGYIIFLTGRKAGVGGDKGWMAFIPIARQIYMTKITRLPAWYIIFLPGLLNYMITAAIGSLFGVALNLPALSMVFFVIFAIVCWVFQFKYYKKLYTDFGFHSYTAWVEIIGSFVLIFKTIGIVFRAAIAFSGRIRYHENLGDVDVTNTVDVSAFDRGGYSAPAGAGAQGGFSAAGGRAVITGIAGKYTGASFDISNGAPVIFGRSSEQANIVFDQFDTDISRKHCTVSYNAASGQYTVVDHSVNGTYANGNRYPKDQPVNVAPGTVIYLGKTQKNGFRIG